VTRMKDRIGKNVPVNRLFRVFSKRDYRDSFVRGEIRLSSLQYYGDMENDIRADVTEGVGAYNHINTVGDKLNISVSSSNEHYIQCFSETSTRKEKIELARRFSGPNQLIVPCIEIMNASLYVQKIATGLENSQFSKGVLDLNWHKVEYSKFEDNRTQAPPLDLEVFQKPKKNIIYKYKNRKTGQLLTLHPSWRISDSVEEFEQKYLPLEIWDKIFDCTDYTCENEWRLAIGLQRKSILQKLKVPVLENNDILIERICKKHHLSENSVKTANKADFALYKRGVYEYVHHIIVESGIDFSDCISKRNVYIWSRLLTRIFWISIYGSLTKK